MKTTGKKDIIKVINKNTEELHNKIDMHCNLMTSIMEQNPDDINTKKVFLPLYYPKESRLEKAIKETIEVLEESRKAFKSKRLEALRKKLTRVLIESK